MIFLDTETSGLNWYNNQICQLSYIKTDDSNNVLLAKNFFLDIDVDVEPGAQQIHGLSNELLKELSGGVKFKDIADEIQRDFEGELVICHNANFDVNFLKAEMHRVDKALSIDGTFCTMKFYTDICALNYNDYYGTYKWPRLDEVLDYCEFDTDEIYQKAIALFGESNEFHDSRFDIAATYEIYKKRLDFVI